MGAFAPREFASNKGFLVYLTLFALPIDRFFLFELLETMRLGAPKRPRAHQTPSVRARRDIAAKAAKKYKLPPGIVPAFVTEESLSAAPPTELLVLA